jgi:ATP-dependent DNA helicase DinG
MVVKQIINEHHYEICDAFNSGYKYVILEALTGFGKSHVAIAVAPALGSSYRRS